jgi:hypothetical protein
MTGDPGPVNRPPIDEHADMWLDDDGSKARRSSHSARRVVGAAVAVVCVAAVGVPIGLVFTTARSSTPGPSSGQSIAKDRVLSALSATISSGSFDMTYSEESPTAPTSTASTTTPCSSVAPGTVALGSGKGNTSAASGNSPGTAGIGWCSYAGPQTAGLAISGQGTIDTSPFAMVASSDVPGIGPVTLRDDGTDVWEIGGGNYGLSPGATDTGPGSSLSGFAGLVEGSLGPREGGLAMMGLSSPSGYLELDQNAITGASEVGTGVVDGVAVTIYQVSLDPAQQANVPGTTAQEAIAIGDALALLQKQGYSGTTVKVSIDDAGYIRQTVSVASFTDGASQTNETTLSDFGCAGTVLMPGQQGATSPPPGCTSPDAATSTTSSTQ